MMDFEDDASRREKCYTSLGRLPHVTDLVQPPKRKSPFAAILGHPWVHTMQILLPSDTYTKIKSSLDVSLKSPQYARVFMSLSSLIEGDFFNAYIKSGNILMISEGRAGSDDLFNLRDGILSLELGKASYERTGLAGKAIRSGGRKHLKERYLVEINLRLPSMLHGKKGFERIAWAFKNVLTRSLSWLFLDLSPGAVPLDDPSTPLAALQPQIIECTQVYTSHPDALVPSFPELGFVQSSPEEDIHESCHAISEWIAMVALRSPQVSTNNITDPYLSRYVVPNCDDAKPSNLVSLTWRGLLSAQWIMQAFCLLLRESSSKSHMPALWFAMSAHAMGRDAVESKDGYTIMVLPPLVPSSCNVPAQQPATNDRKSRKEVRNFICWEFVGSSIL